MRLVSGLILALAVSACGEPAQPDADAAGAGQPQPTAEKIQAERACAELTGYSPEPGAGGPVETRARREREYKACVNAVTSGGPGDEAQPKLRGRSETSDS